MKVTIDIDCTPEEARTFFGLPDVKQMQSVMMEKLQAQMTAQMEQLDPAEIMKTWMTPGIEGFGQLQKAMWAAATNPSFNDEKK
ncbi:MAG: DUF6489 family protein [Anderseniella sp.]